MKLFVALFALVAVAAAQVSNEYLPPNYGGDADPSGVSYSVAASAPAASYETYDVGASAPAHSFSDADGYRYKTHRRRVVKVARRHRRGVSTEYLPPAASAPSNEYLAPVAAYSAPSVSYAAPVETSYSVAASAPAASYETYDVGASAPAHSYSDAEGYRYKTQRRRVVKVARRHRRGVSTEYLPPAASAPSNEYLAPVASYSAPAATYAAPVETSYTVAASAPAPVAFESYETAGTAPAHSFSEADGYRYKTQRRRVVKVARRHRRGVSTEYLPPAASAPSNEYLAPVAAYSAPAATYAAPVETSYSVAASAPAASFETYDVGASAPAHSFSDADGYRYKTQRRRVVKVARRHRRDVSSEYLPPVASAPAVSYAQPAASYSSASYSTPEGSYTIEASSPGGVHETFETAGAAPAHSFSEADGYRYKTARRRVIRRRQ